MEYVLGVFALVFAACAFFCMRDDELLTGIICLAVSGTAGYFAHHESLPSTKAAAAAEQVEKAARKAAERTPHVIREADGCKVYAFVDDFRTHYFTRCGNNRVSTESSWTEKHGKSTVTKTETINTEVAGNE